MSIQYAGGTNVNTTFTCTTGTRREIVDGIVAALTTAGWSTVSGAGTGTVVMRSASTPTAANSIDIRVYDPGSGNCAQVRIQNAAATLTGQIAYLLPVAGRVFRVIANKYQFFCFTDGGTVEARGFVMVCVPYIPSFLHGVITAELGISTANGETDTGTTVRNTFRTFPGTVMGGSSGMSQGIIMNGVAFNRTANSSDSCDMRLVIPVSAWTDDYAGGDRWHDGSFLLSEPLMAWGMVDTEVARIRGQLWDAVWCSEAFAADLSNFSFDSQTWYSITSNCAGNATNAKGTLLVMIPTP